MTLSALLALAAVAEYETRPARRISCEASGFRSVSTKKAKTLRIARKRKRHHNKHCGSGR